MQCVDVYRTSVDCLSSDCLLPPLLLNFQSAISLSDVFLSKETKLTIIRSLVIYTTRVLILLLSYFLIFNLSLILLS